MSAAALIVTFNLNLNRQATTISSKLRNYFQMFLLKTTALIVGLFKPMQCFANYLI